MSTIDDVPDIRDRARRWSVDEYERMAEQGLLPKRVELIRGAIIDKMAKSPLHRALSKRLYHLILSALPPGFVAFREDPLRLGDSEPEPDVAIVRGTEEEFEERHPTTAALVVEVAVSTAALDRAYAAMYAEAGVEEYWIVLARERSVEIYTHPVAGAYTRRTKKAEGETLTCASLPGVVLPIEKIFSPAKGDAKLSQ